MRVPFFNAFIFSVSVAVLSGCASNKPQISVNNAQNFAQIRTFYVKPPMNSVNATLESHLSSTITETLSSKGLNPVSQDEADVQVGFLPFTERKEEGKSLNLGLGTGVFGRTTGISLGSIFSIPVGEQVTRYQNLQIDVVKDGTYIYSAAGSTELEASDSITVQRQLTSLVRELLQPYPANNTTEQPKQ